ncbi:hypothetical protein CEUSTIGMA_g4148.t1 [Chlamydomonas eustigma]|uniref:Uncharacterized protein n=1 Tax=Chlamydomonas eustigma TaxID=1157962 RepID=A0A250X1D7_9CHLO|nr:hypothetical protein CEUSTIGMA_g4148.t1 [Chlamydomonas eustigma]|eukprot:GAX76702.1 hypothetical protein CEUSTIGMA_g4148.t1 [Chlamydomonas eustigma]
MWRSNASMSKREQTLNQTVLQLSTGAVALSHEVSAEPQKGLARVMQHLQESSTSLVAARYMLQDLILDMKAIQEEQTDNSLAIEAWTSGGLESLRRAQRNASLSTNDPKVQQHVQNEKRTEISK